MSNTSPQSCPRTVLVEGLSRMQIEGDGSVTITAQKLTVNGVIKTADPSIAGSPQSSNEQQAAQPASNIPGSDTADIVGWFWGQR